MNLALPVGLLTAAAVVAYATMNGIRNSEIFLSPHAVIIVCGGTFAAAMVCFPFSFFRNMALIFFRAVTGRVVAETHRTFAEIVVVAKDTYAGGEITGSMRKVQNPFLRESLELVESSGLNIEELESVLEKRLEVQHESYKQNGIAFRIIGKFPPAFGLVGTTVGMISLLQSLGGKDAFAQLGPAMSLALVATFYGLILANCFLIPLSENLHQASQQDLLTRRMVLDGVKLIREKKHPVLVEEYLKSYLSPKDRNRLRNVREAA